MKINKLLSLLVFSILTMLLFSVTTFAYIDPSAMTYLIQIVAGVAIAATAAFGFYWRRIKRFFSKRKKDTQSDDFDYELDDDDDEGYDDYEMDEDDEAIDEEASVVSTASAAKESVRDTSSGIPSPETVSYKTAPAFTEADIRISEPVPDRFDEGSSLDMLVHENRELRRLLAIEREKVDILKKSLHICTGSDK